MSSFNTTYSNPSNIVYHIRESGVLINGDTLRLVGNEKKNIILNIMEEKRSLKDD